MLCEKYPNLNDMDFIEHYDFDDCWTVKFPDQPYEELDVAVALARAKGNLSGAARLLRRPRRSLQGFVARSILLTEWMEDIESEFLDAIEEGYRESALSGDDTARRFFLVTKGKERGYVSRNETTGKNGEALGGHISRDWSSAGIDELRNIKKALEKVPQHGRD